MSGGLPIGNSGAGFAPDGGGANGLVFDATVEGGRPASDYTIRVLPRFEGLSVPLEDARVLWQSR